MKAKAISFCMGLALAFASRLEAQPSDTPADAMEMAGTSSDLFVMLGSDFVRPGLEPKANYNIGVGHTFGILKKDPIGDELTFSYTYEDGGSGFWHSGFGSHTEAGGVMKNFNLPKTSLLSGYTMVQLGVSTFTGSPHLQNHFYNGEALGGIIHLNSHNSIWFQDAFNKIVTVPWYTTFSVGYTRSW
jgi:hypothetical protein